MKSNNENGCLFTLALLPSVNGFILYTRDGRRKVGLPSEAIGKWQSNFLMHVPTAGAGEDSPHDDRRVIWQGQSAPYFLVPFSAHWKVTTYTVWLSVCTPKTIALVLANSWGREGRMLADTCPCGAFPNSVLDTKWLPQVTPTWLKNTDDRQSRHGPGNGRVAAATS